MYTLYSSVDCGQPGAPQRGSLESYTSTTEGSEVFYRCDPGLVPEGTMRAVCTRSGWSQNPADLTCNIGSVCACVRTHMHAHMAGEGDYILYFKVSSVNLVFQLVEYVSEKCFQVLPVHTYFWGEMFPELQNIFQHFIQGKGTPLFFKHVSQKQ